MSISISCRIIIIHNLDDDEFRNMTVELQIGPISFDESRLSTLIYNPLSFSSRANRNFSNSGLIDPDANFYRDVYNCNYYTEHKFNEKLHNENRSNDLSFLHINIRSLSRNFDAFSLFLNNIETKLFNYWSL